MTPRQPFLVALVLVFSTAATAAAADRLTPYLEALERGGEEPVAFVARALDQHDLILFDDALHSAVEPFELYAELARSAEVRGRARTFFVEVLGVDRQAEIDRYLASQPEDLALLRSILQADLGGSGWPLQTYVDFLRAVRAVNRDLGEDERVRVVAVNDPVHWGAIRDRGDLALMRKALVGRDHSMYRLILDELDGFRSGRKGIFLTNTRHAYNLIRDREHRPHWNTATFFHRWHPGRSYSIRIHNIALEVLRRREATADEATTAGMERFEHRWVRMEQGLWDSAFAARGDRPVALALAGTPFGSARYVGNHQADAAPGQSMADAHDALLFLAPLEKLRLSATGDLIYTDAFREELERRYPVLYSAETLARRVAEAGVADLAALVAHDVAPRAERRVADVFELGPIDEWKTAPAPVAPVPPPGCRHQELEALAFLEGEWRVASRYRLPGGEWEETEARSSIRRELGGCLLVETLHGIRGGERFEARVTHAWDGLAGHLQRAWADLGHGVLVLYTGPAAEAGIDFRTRLEIRGREVLFRHAFSDVTGDGFAVRSERSLDDGESWRPSWSLTYRRAH